MPRTSHQLSRVWLLTVEKWLSLLWRCPDQLYNPPTLLFNGYCGFWHLDWSGWYMNLITHLHRGPRWWMSGAIPLLSLYAFMTFTGTNLPPTHDSSAHQHKLTLNIFTTFKTICTSFRYIQELYIFAHCSVSNNAVFVIFNLVIFHLHISINCFLGNATRVA